MTARTWEEDLDWAVDVIRTAQKAKQPRWCPHKPDGRQPLFLELDCLEAFYGGAAGGGKSDALLMAALEYVHVPEYAALLLRRTYADLSLPDAIMTRARDWLSRIPAAKWNDKEKTWRFPSGATLTFGYLESEGDKYRYQGSAYQFIGFDELTQFTDTQYLYLFSRLRRLEGAAVPLRMRSASNPGGVGAEWVKYRFIPEDFLPQDAQDPRVWWVEGEDDKGETVKRAFVPARLQDNPHLDYDAYLASLNRLDKVTREQLLVGDWTITATGRLRFDAESIAKFHPVRGTEGLVITQVDLQQRETQEFRPQPGGEVAIWRRPERGHRYAIGADTAQGRDVNRGEGTAKGDYCVAQVRDTSGEQVARYRARIGERGFAVNLYAIARWYNNAYIVPEVAGGYGRAMLDHLVLDLGYPMECVFRTRGVANAPSASITMDDLGWTTNTVTRPQMESALDTAILEHAIETYDPVTIAEYLSYEYDKNGKAQGRTGTHDDCVMADAMCIIGLERMPRVMAVDRAAVAARRYAPSMRELMRESYR